ncbi:MAG: amidotransferase [Bacteroidetes bacterium]|nr:MAG: amidotransferase [Bacteroidota bacterium]
MKSKLNVHCFMHVPFEGPGVIADWVTEKGHSLRFTRFYENDPLPGETVVDLAVVMGGPASVYEKTEHPWMQGEIGWLEKYINTGKPLIGICLGAQLIAAALGAEVFPGKEKEIGWHPVEFLPSLGDFRIWENLPAGRKVFHWHGDTFSIPAGASRIACSKAYPNQGFIYGGHVIALQFHLEVTPVDVENMAGHFGDELRPATYVQSVSEILEERRHYMDNQELIFQLLDYLRGLV